MLSRAASQLGIEVKVLDPEAECPAKRSVARCVQGDWRDADTLLSFAEGTDLLTLENEFIEAGLLAKLEDRGHVVLPTSKTMALVQDKLTQKQTLQAAGLSVIDFAPVASEAEGLEALKTFGFPCVLKRRTLGYDGTGNFTVKSPESFRQGVERLGGYGVGLYLEKWCEFERELAVMVVRSRTGETAVYPVVETRQRNHVCSSVLAPAAASEALAETAHQMALGAIEAVSGVGTFGIEFFLTAEGKLLINEMAPRVHNSGHYTIEACDCSQFENHLRAILDLPLGKTALRKPAAMVNLLADAAGSGFPKGFADALGVAGASLHLYGKTKAAPGRKMGHITSLGDDAESALEVAQAAADHICFKAL